MLSQKGIFRMIDMLVLRCDFAKIQNPMVDTPMPIFPDFRLSELGIPVEQSVDRDGEVFNTRHPWESIPSSYDSMAFKVFDHRYDELDKFYIEIKASPAKIMLGHNVFGSSDFHDCCWSLMELLYETYPFCEHLDHSSWSLAQIDITYSSRAKDTNESKAFINALHSVSFGQTKCRTGYDGTAYFGKKNSRLKKIKVYSKYPELVEVMKKNERKPDGHLINEFITPEIQEFSKGLIRWESSLYSRYFERLGIPSLKLKDLFLHNTFSPENQIQFWQKSTADLFKALAGQTMKILNDHEIKQQLRANFSKVSAKTGKTSTAAADNAYRTYLDIRRDGYHNTMESMARRTFYDRLTMLTDCGLSRAALQNMDGIKDGAQIIPFVRFIQVDFCNQLPEGYQLPPPKHIYQPKPLLQLVA